MEPQHIVADIGSGTGLIGEDLAKSCGLNNPVWCVDPSAEMQDIARKRTGVKPVQKTAEEFFADPEITHRFDRIIAVWSTHHFVDRDGVFKGIVRSLRPGGCFVQVHTITSENPILKMAKNTWGTLSKGVSASEKLMLGFTQQGKTTQEEFTYTPQVTKAKLYNMFRGRYMSMFLQLSDEQIEEGINELEKGPFKDVKNDDSIDYNCVVRMTKFELQ